MPRSLLAFVAVMVASCSSDSGTTVSYTVAVKTAPPASAAAGTPIPIAFTVTEIQPDGSSAPAVGKTFTVTVTAGGGTIAGGSFVQVTTANDGSASATWVLGSTPGAQTVRGSIASDKYLDVSVTATAPVASQLAFVTAPSTSVVSGVALATQPVVQLKDANGNAVQQAGVAVTASIPLPGATLGGGSLTVNTDGTGKATFAGLAITGLPGGKVLQFAATLNGAAVTITAPVAVVPGPPTQLTVTTQPSATAQSNVAFAQQPIVQIQDAAGNMVTLSGVAVIVTIETGGGALTGSIGVNTVAGAAGFSGLTITGTAGSRTLRFSATVNGAPLTVTSNAIVVGP